MNAKVPEDILEQTARAAEADWKDPKRYLWLLSPALPAIGLAAISAYAVAPKKLRALALHLKRRPLPRRPLPHRQLP